MKTFLILFAVISLSAAEPHLHPEGILSRYITTNTAIREILKNMSSTFDHVNTESKKLILDINRNITYLRRICGTEKSRYFRNKYHHKLNELKRQPIPNESCVRHAETILSLNVKQQQRLSQFINESLEYWNEEYTNFDKVITNIRFDLTGLEDQARRCSFHFDGSDDQTVWLCAEVAFEKAQRIELNASIEIPRQLASLIIRKDDAMEMLYKEVNDKNILSFYGDKHQFDDWFAINCPLPPKIVVTTY